jgi:hypothetical protein
MKGIKWMERIGPFMHGRNGKCLDFQMKILRETDCVEDPGGDL